MGKGVVWGGGVVGGVAGRTLPGWVRWAKVARWLFFFFFSRLQYGCLHGLSPRPVARGAGGFLICWRGRVTRALPACSRCRRRFCR